MKKIHTLPALQLRLLLPESIAVFFVHFWLVLFLFISHIVHAESITPTGEIKGKITDEKKEGMISATVSILDAADKSTNHGTVSDYDGNYTLTSLQPGIYTLKFSYAGYASQTVQGIRVDSGKATFQNIALAPSGQVYSECVVISYKKPLIDYGDTRIEQSVTAADIRNQGALAVEDVAASTAGVTQTDAGGAITINGSREDEVQYIVNGHRMMNSQAAEPDMMPAPVPVVSVAPIKQDKTSTAQYKTITENEFKSAWGEPLSTFSIDVDAASYSIIRRMVQEGKMPPADALRAEEMINYFPYNYDAPQGKDPFSIHTELADCPWAMGHQLLKIGIQGKKVAEEDMPPANLVFLVDVSGSMMSPERLPLVQYALNLLTDRMRPQDHISLVAYAGNAGLVLPSTKGDDKDKIKKAINSLQAGGSTAGGAGIELAYKVAERNFIKGGNNRIILCTDGDFNVGISSDEGLVKMIEEKRKSGVFLSAIGVGTDNYKDAKMEQLADKGNGNYSYLDNVKEAKKIMVTQMGGTILTIAKDVKIQTVFNPAIVKSYRLIGYENRKLAAKDFKNDKVDAGEIGAGACVTALYEVVLGGQKDAATVPLAEGDSMHLTAQDLMEVRVRYKAPDGDKSTLIENNVGLASTSMAEASTDFRFATSVAAYTMLLRGSQYSGDFTFDKVLALAKGSLGTDENGYRKEFTELVKDAGKLQASLAAK